MNLNSNVNLGQHTSDVCRKVSWVTYLLRKFRNLAALLIYHNLFQSRVGTHRQWNSGIMRQVHQNHSADVLLLQKTAQGHNTRNRSHVELPYPTIEYNKGSFLQISKKDVLTCHLKVFKLLELPEFKNEIKKGCWGRPFYSVGEFFEEEKTLKFSYCLLPGVKLKFDTFLTNNGNSNKAFMTYYI